MITKKKKTFKAKNALETSGILSVTPLVLLFPAM